MRKKLTRRTSVIILGVQIALMAGLSAVTTVIVSENADRGSVEHMKALADSKAVMTEEYVDNAERTLGFYSCSPEIIAAAENPDDPDVTAAAQRFTEKFSEKVENLEGIYVSEWNTHVLAHTSPEVAGITTRRGEFLKQLQDALTAAGDGVCDTGIIISPASGRQIVSMYKGIFRENGEPAGLAGLGVYTDGLVERLSENRYDIFKNAEYCLVNVSDEKYVFSSNPEKISENAENAAIKELCGKLNGCQNDETGSFSYVSSVSGEKYISVYHYMAKRGWILVVNDVQSEVFSLSYTMLIYLIVFFIAITVISAVIGHHLRSSALLSEKEFREKEKKHSEEMEAILSTLPENSAVSTVDIAEDIFMSYHGENDVINTRIRSGDMSEAIEISRDVIMQTTSDSEQKEKIADILDRDRLLKSFENNTKKLSCSYSRPCDDGSIDIMELSVNMLQNMVSGNTEAVIQVSDISDDYYRNAVGTFLAMRQFILTTLVFVKTGRGRDIASNTDNWKESKFYDYSAFLDDIYNRLIDKNERDEFIEKMSIENVRKNLEKDRTYSVRVHAVSEYSGKTYLNYEFQYIDDSREVVLLSLADVTPEWEVDVLTGLHNYKGFISQAEYGLDISGESDEFSVLVTNVKWFRVINRMFGGHRCDKFLKSYAEELKNSAFEPLVTGRLTASDHFIMLVRRENVLTDEMIRLSRKSISADEREVDVFVTFGIYNIQDKTMSAADMVDHALTASKNIRDVYSEPYSVFSELEEERYLSGKLVVSEFDRALRNGEFMPFYQPVYDAVTHKVVSAEALVRWKKDGSLIPPGMFIPALEENGSISRVDLHISDCVTEFLIRRKSEGRKIVPVSVNLSVMDFYASDTVEGVMNDISIMKQHGIVPRYEVTETAWSDASDNRNETINTMRAGGARILIDDFGSGYSSFSTIRDFSFDILKIDMGFVRKIGTSQKADGIVTSIIDMAHFIGLKVIAEGVETKDHLDFLTEHGCDYIQGYYFSKPLPEEEFEKLLDEE